MNIKSILLGTAAGLMAASGAMAADMPAETAPVAVDYVKVCEANGKGYFTIPGSTTCLKIDGRVRARVEYDAYNGPADKLIARADGRVGISALTATDYGTLRSYFRVDTTSNGGKYSRVTYDDEGKRQATDSSNTIGLGEAYIQIGYLTVGYSDPDTIFNNDTLYGENDGVYGDPNGDNNVWQANVLVDDLGGGFFVGGQVIGNESNFESVNSQALDASNLDDEYVAFAGSVGIAKQSWGDFQVSADYALNGPDNGDADNNLFLYGKHAFFVKATANLGLLENLQTRFTVGYGSIKDAPNPLVVSGALSYQFTPELDAYAGLRWDFQKGKDTAYANAGVDYTLAPGLIATAELNYTNYADQGNVTTGLLMLSRTW